jgi:hypothetical protein
MSWWLANLILRGHLTLVEGEEGVGKGYFAIWSLVCLSKGLWGPKTPGLYLTSEEEPVAVQERLRAAGWDPATDAPIHVLRVDGGDDVVKLPLDFAAMAAYIKQYGYGIVVVDVLRDHCAPTEDMGIRQRSNNDETWIRPAAGAWERLAATTGATVLGLHHRNKSREGNARSKSMGSGAWRQRARAVIVLAEVGDSRAIAMDKQNIGRKIAGVWSFDLEEVTEEYGRFVLGELDDRYKDINVWEKSMRKLEDVDFEFDPKAEVEAWCERAEANGALRDAVGDIRLPAKEVLQRETSLSREKVQQAIAGLVQDGYVVIKPVGNLTGYSKYFWHRNGQDAQ